MSLNSEPTSSMKPELDQSMTCNVLSTIMHPSTMMTNTIATTEVMSDNATILSTTICSTSPPFSSQNETIIIDQHDYIDNFDHKNSVDMTLNKDRSKKFSFSSIASVSDSGNESIVDDDFVCTNEKLLFNFFVQDNSKTINLARKRLSCDYRHSLKLKEVDKVDDYDDVAVGQYDSDDESTLYETSFQSSPPAEFDTAPSDDTIFNFDTVCNAIDKQLKNADDCNVSKEKHNTFNVDKLATNFNDNNNSNNNPKEDTAKLNDNLNYSLQSDDSNLLKEYCNDERRNSVLTRSTSLKTGKTPPGTPGAKKIVRFADVLGLDLASIRHIVYDDPYVPPLCAFKALKLDDDDRDWLVSNRSDNTQKQLNKTGNNCSKQEVNSVLRMLFPQPSADPIAFMERVRSNKICLENCMLTSSGNRNIFTITCLVRVLNICFQKEVILRYTTNEWLTWNDVAGSYVKNSNDGFSDKFSIIFELAFNANGHQIMMPGQRLLFAIRYSTDGSNEFWDNNVGMNYALIYQRC